MFDFLRALTPLSMPGYAFWKWRGGAGEVDLAFRMGARTRMRREDYGAAYEVFASRFYQSPRPLDPSGVHHIIDLGANVGMTVLFWLHAYPGARITAFEPHPAHVARLHANVALNAAGARVNVHESAAGTRVSQWELIDAGMSSSLVAPGAVANAIPVNVEDVFETLLAGTVDILKIDIEGSEFAILDDARFRNVKARALVLEWHRDSRERAAAWCEDVLRAAGYDVVPLFDKGDHGMTWAYHKALAA